MVYLSTLKDVAEYAGVSIATVSCCISGAKNVRAETRERVTQAIETLQYIPNFSARDLKKPDSREIGVILTDIDDGYYAELLKGVTSSMQRNGYNVSIAFSDGIPATESALIEGFISKRAAGMILVSCQPHNCDFFRRSLESHGMPAIFIGHRPREIEHSFVDFENRKTMSFLIEGLLDKGYRDILLLCGPAEYSCEEDCVKGYAETFRKRGVPADSRNICHTNMSKEDAFKNALFAFDHRVPQAVITTSTNIAKGVLEAAAVQGIRVPEELSLITFGEECWNRSNRLPGVIHTSRPAFSLGTRAAELLLENIDSPILFEKQSVLLSDSVLEAGLSLPDPRAAADSAHPRACADSLKILMMDLNTSNAVRIMSGYFTHLYGCDVDITFSDQDSLLQKIVDDATIGKNKYDIYMFDVPWLPYLAQNQLVEDISEFVTGDDFRAGDLLPENLKNCDYLGRYFGIPIVSGAQILFYRKDLFENPQLQQQFKKKYKIALRTPRTWTEFNGVAEFFTKAYNPSSPVDYGASLAGSNNQSLAPELLIRIAASGGKLFDSRNNVQINSPQIVKAFHSARKTLQYTGGAPADMSIQRTVRDFCEGRTAMLVTYSEYASQITSMSSSVAGKVGYSLLPGRTPLSIGWNLGMSPFTRKREEVCRFFNWLCRQDTSYYMTILNGQSAVASAYSNHELLKLYPWMNLTIESFPQTYPRTGPYRANALVIPQSLLEGVLCEAFRKVCTEDQPVKDALDEAQVKLKHLLRSYGYYNNPANE